MKNLTNLLRLKSVFQRAQVCRNLKVSQINHNYSTLTPLLHKNVECNRCQNIWILRKQNLYITSKWYSEKGKEESESAKSNNEKTIKDTEDTESNNEKTIEKTEGTEPNNENNSKKNSKSKLAKLIASYGVTGIVFHQTLSFASLGICYTIVSSGVDVVGLLQSVTEYFGYKDIMGDASSKLAGGATTFALAYALHKPLMPLRVACTLTCTPIIVKKLRAFKERWNKQ